MASKRKPKLDAMIRGVQVRVYASRSEYEALVGPGDIDDPNAFVMCYPKIGDAFAWADQAALDYQREMKSATE